MYGFYVLLMIVIGYLSGSVCGAIVFTKIVTGKDIRELGNRNPGTSNVGRSVGKGWATAVFFLDVFKAVVPMILARWLFFPGNTYLDFLPVFATGIAAIVGHCKPIYYRFQGGGGAATSIAVYMFFIPVEIFLAMLLAFIIVMVFFRNVKYSIGRYTPILFITMVPFLTLALNWTMHVPLFLHVSIGGHPWPILAGVFMNSISLLLLNYPLLRAMRQ